MRNADYYPAGAADDPRAPYNQVDPPEIEMECSATVVLNKDTLVTTDKVYWDGEDWVLYLATIRLNLLRSRKSDKTLKTYLSLFITV